MFDWMCVKDLLQFCTAAVYTILYYTIPDFADLLPEISFWKRIALGWAAFGKAGNIMRGRKTSVKIKRKIHNQYIRPIHMALRHRRWTVNAMMEKLAVVRRKTERIMLGITLRDRKRNTWTRQDTGVSDITNTIRKAKHRWAGHLARLSDNRWTIRATEWTPRFWTRKQGRPKTRWRDDPTR